MYAYKNAHTHTCGVSMHVMYAIKLRFHTQRMEMVAVLQLLLTPLLLQLLLLLIFSMIFIFHPKWLFIEPMACAYCREWRDAHNFPSSYEKRMSEAHTHTYTGKVESRHHWWWCFQRTCTLEIPNASARSIIDINIHMAKNQLWCDFFFFLLLISLLHWMMALWHRLSLWALN